MVDLGSMAQGGIAGRLGKSIKGVIVGVVMFLAAFPVLFINEGCAVKRYRELQMGREHVVEASADTVDSAKEGKLVHLVGEATTEETLTDKTFNLSQENAIHLRRQVEIYQVKEHKKKKDNSTTYSYSEEWCDGYVDSSKFNDASKRVNKPPKWQGDRSHAKKVTVGAYRLSDGLKGKVNRWEKVVLDDQTVAAMPQDQVKDLKLHDGVLYAGADPATPQINDCRVSFHVVKPCMVSLMAAQMGDTFTPYTQDGETLEPLLVVGEQSAEQMIQAEESANSIRTWLIRGGGFVLMFFGLLLIFAPLTALADMIPIIGGIVGLGAMLISGVIAFAAWAVTVALAWVWYRPLIGIPLLVLAVGAVVALFVLAKKRRSAALPEAPGGPQAPM